MGKRILVIDDQVDVRNAFELALEGTGIEVDTAGSGAAGLEKIQARRYDLIFLDLKMPGMNGIETLQTIREKNADLPVYLITAFHQEFLHELQALQEKGHPFELLNKPLEMDQIKRISCAVLNGTASAY